MTTPKSQNRSTGDTLFRGMTLFGALAMLAAGLGLVYELTRWSLPALSRFGFGFLWGHTWNPVSQNFGALSSLWGTVTTTVIAMALALPSGLLIAFFLVELAPPWLSRILGQMVELLASIPSIIYGMWGLFVFAPFLSDHIQPFLGKTLGWLPLFKGPPMGLGILAAGLILALMVLPFITAVSRDVLAMTPNVTKESAFGMGATTWEVFRHIMIPNGLPGLMGAGFLGMARALGETMAVTFVIGNSHTISASLFSPGTSIASTLANEFTEASEPLYLSSLVALGLVLLALSVGIQGVARWWLKRVKQRLEGTP